MSLPIRGKQIWPAIQELLHLQHLTRVKTATITIPADGFVTVVAEFFPECPQQTSEETVSSERTQDCNP